MATRGVPSRGVANAWAALLVRSRRAFGLLFEFRCDLHSPRARPVGRFGIVSLGPGPATKIEKISRGAVPSEAQQVDQQNANARAAPSPSLVYGARIRLLRNHVTVHGRRQSIGPGMAVQAEIRTGRRRIIQYLLSPISQAIDEAGRER